MKETGIIMSGDHPKLILDGTKTMTRRVIKPCSTATLFDGSQPEWVFTMAKCPHGQVGDRLWVKETWWQDSDNDIYYKADWQTNPRNGKWKPSRFMPRWASRITLEITEVRVERVQEISAADCFKEGVEMYKPIQQFQSLWDSLNAKRGFGWEVNPWVWVIRFKF